MKQAVSLGMCGAAGPGRSRGNEYIAASGGSPATVKFVAN